MERRRFLGLSVGAAAATVAAPYVHAQAKRFAGVTIRVNGYGGDYERVLKETVAAPLQEKYGLTVQYIPGVTQSDIAKLIAAKDDPPYDLFMCDSPHMVQLMPAGVIEELGTSDIPSLSRVAPAFREFGGYGAPFSVGSMVPVYNARHVKEPLRSYSDIARPDLKGRVAIFPSGQAASAMMILALAEENGGGVGDPEPAFQLLRRSRENVVAMFPTVVAGVQMFSQEEAYAGLFWDGRAFAMRKAGTPVQTVFPEKGVYALLSYINVVKGTKHPEAARAYVEQVLSDQGMAGLPNFFRYGPTTDVKLADEVEKDILLTGDKVSRKRPIDWAKLDAVRANWFERYSKEMRA